MEIFALCFTSFVLLLLGLWLSVGSVVAAWFGTAFGGSLSRYQAVLHIVIFMIGCGTIYGSSLVFPFSLEVIQ